MKQGKSRQIIRTIALAATAACGDTGYAPVTNESNREIAGSAEQAVNACEGDDLQYDFNAFAASLAVAMARELGRWNASTDLVVSNGKVALSSGASSTCGSTGCQNTKAILQMQDDVTSGVPNHSPSVFRNRLVGWHQDQMAKLTELATASKLPVGSYQFKNKNSGKFMVVDNGSTNDNAVVEQGALNGDAANWVASVVGTKHKFQNKKSGKCLDLASNSSSDNVGIVQKACSSAATQNFDLVKIDGGLYALKTNFGKQIVAYNWGTGNDVKLVQVSFQQHNANGQWTVNAVGDSSNPANTIFKAMYALSFYSTGTSKVMAPVSSLESAAVKLSAYSASNPLHQWYSVPVNGKYQLINRGSGKCLALASDSSNALLAQKTCANDAMQLFTADALPTADHFSLTTKFGKFIEVQNAQTTVGTAIAQATGSADPHRRVRFSPIAAAEPHKLSFSHATDDAPCGKYYWYNVTQPNGMPLASAEQTFMHLIFAGGKTSLTGRDPNPFIAQLSTGTQVAVDPSGYMVPTGTETTGSCIASDIYVDLAKAIGGKCCTKYTGATGTFQASSWSPTTFLCK